MLSAHHLHARLLLCSLGMPWLDGFMADVGSNTPDGIALHYYGDNAGAATSYISMMHDRYNLDVWVTEIASTSSDLTSVQAFQSSVMSFASQNSAWLRGVFWFCVSRHADEDDGLTPSALMASNGSKLDLGNSWCTD